MQKSLKSFFIIWIGQAISLLGSQLVQFALIWWLTQTTGSATILAAATLVGLLPQVLLGPIVGVLVDRWNRRLILLVSDSTVAAATLLLAYLFWANVAQTWHVFAILFIRAIAGSFHFSTMAASTSLMVPNQHLARVQGLNQMLQGGMSILSAPLGAFLLGVLPLQGMLMIDFSTALCAIIPLLFIAIPQPKKKVDETAVPQKSSMMTDFQEGLRYMWGWPGLMFLMVMAMVINFLLNPAFSLLPLLVKDHFQGGAIQLGWLESASGLGVISGGLLLGVWGGFKRRILTSSMGLLGIGLFTLLLGVLPTSAFWLAVAAFLCLGISMPITNGPIFAIFQSTVAPEMQGRVFSLIGSLSAAMAPIGLIIAGPVADTIGVRSWYVVGGIVTLLMGVICFITPTIRHIEDGRSPSAELLSGEQYPITYTP